MTMQIITLLALVIAIFIGFKRSVNTGFVAITFSLFVGVYLVGLKPKGIIAGFPTSLFMTLLGMTFLFAVAKVNNTMEMFALKVTYLSKGNLKILPIIIFIMCAFISAIGPGPIVVTALMAPIALSIADQEDIPPILMSTIVISGAVTGGLSPICPSGIVASSLATEIGITNYSPIFLCVAIATLIQGIVFYIIFGGYKLKSSSGATNKPADFNSSQKQTLVVIALVVIGIIFFKSDIGLTAFAGGTILLLIDPSKQKDVIANISWGTLILIFGVALLVNVVTVAGGIDALTTLLTGIMTERLAAPILAIIAGLMSAVSSASGVVMPTLIPTVPGVAETLGNVSMPSLVGAIVVGAHAVTYSPLSTVGALCLAAAGSKADKNKFFTQLLVVGFSNVLFVAILGFFGFYRICG